MKNVIKSLVAAILALTTVISAVPAFATNIETDLVIFSEDGKILLDYPETITDKEYTVPDGTVHISENAFASNPYIEKVILPETLKSIEHGAFNNCTALKSIILPANLESFYTDDNYSVASFSGCTNLESIEVDNENKTYKSVDGVVFSKDGKILVYYPAGKKDETYSVPSGTETVGWASFCCHSFIKHVVIPDGVTKIDGWAFLGSSIETISIPKSMQSIGWNGVENCSNLHTVYYAGNEKEFYSIEINEYDVDLSLNNASLFEAELVCEEDLALIKKIFLYIPLIFKYIFHQIRCYGII